MAIPTINTGTRPQHPNSPKESPSQESLTWFPQLLKLLPLSPK